MQGRCFFLKLEGVYKCSESNINGNNKLEADISYEGFRFLFEEINFKYVLVRKFYLGLVH